MFVDKVTVTCHFCNDRWQQFNLFSKF